MAGSTPYSPWREAGPANTLTSGLQDLWFWPPSSWFFVTAATGNSHASRTILFSEAYTSAFSVQATERCGGQHHLIPERGCHPQKKPRPHQQSLPTLPTPSPPFLCMCAC